jgi:hypothetical protein
MQPNDLHVQPACDSVFLQLSRLTLAHKTCLPVCSVWMECGTCKHTAQCCSAHRIYAWQSPGLNNVSISSLEELFSYTPTFFTCSDLLDRHTRLRLTNRLLDSYRCSGCQSATKQQQSPNQYAPQLNCDTACKLIESDHCFGPDSGQGGDGLWHTAKMESCRRR